MEQNENEHGIYEIDYIFILIHITLNEKFKKI